MRGNSVSLLSPKGIGGILSAAWRECIAHSGTAALAVVLAMLPVAAMSAASGYLSVSLGVLKMQEDLQSGAMSPTGLDFRPFIILGAYGVAAAIVGLVCGFLAVGAVARILAERAVGRRIGVAEAFDFVLGSLLRLVGGAVVQGLVLLACTAVVAVPVVVVAGLLAAGAAQSSPGQPPVMVSVVAVVMFVVPLAILGAYLSPMAPAAAVEGLGGFAALKRGFWLVAGHFGRVFGAILLVGVLAGGVPAGVGAAMNAWALKPLQQLAGEASGALLASLAQQVVMLVLVPFSYTLQAVLYLDLRARKDEGFSARELAADLGHELPEEAESLASAPPEGRMM